MSEDRKQAPEANPQTASKQDPHGKATPEAGEADKLPTIGSPDTGAEQVTKPTTKPE